MTFAKGHTAILIFAKNAYSELRSKTFFSPVGYQKNLAIAQYLNKKVLSLAKGTSLPTFQVSEKEQVGATFGARLSRAVQDTFAKGFEQIIILGNDCPTLTNSHLEEAATTLSPSKMVLGPALDGGAYLIGLHRSHFDPNTFENLPWGSDQLMLEMQQDAFNHQIEVVRLTIEIDVDHSEDFQFLLKNTRNRRLVNILLNLLCLLQPKNWISLPLNPSFRYLEVHHLRGPPQYYT